MSLPIDVVVELLMANCQENGECGHESDMWIDLPSGATISDATSKRLRSKVREYLLTLVPKPVLLSECEEGRLRKCAYRVTEYMRRQGKYACDRYGKSICLASDVEILPELVIQPVEVQ